MRHKTVRETASLSNNRMMGNIGNWRERLKDIVEKEAREAKKKTDYKKEQAKRDGNLASQEHERVLKLNH